MTDASDRALERMQRKALADIQQPEGLISFRWSSPPSTLTPTGTVLTTAEEHGYSLRVTRVFGETFRAVLRTPAGEFSQVTGVDPPSEREHLFMVKWAPDDMQLRVRPVDGELPSGPAEDAHPS